MRLFRKIALKDSLGKLWCGGWVGCTTKGGRATSRLLRRVLRRVLGTAFEKALRRVLRTCLAVGSRGKRVLRGGSKKGLSRRRSEGRNTPFSRVRPPLRKPYWAWPYV